MTVAVAGGVALRRATLLGAGLALGNTLISTGADAAAKRLIAHYAAPQLMLLSGALAVAVGLLLALPGGQRQVVQTGRPGLVALRSALGAASTLGFFYALRFLPFAEIFLFIALMPLLAALISAMLFGDRVAAPVWGALAMGLAGMGAMMPASAAGSFAGHLVGLAAAVTGSASIVLSRRICRSHTHSFAQVFYAQLACLALGALAAPFVWQPMAAGDLALVGLYTGFLLGTRWLMVVIVRLIPAHVVLQLANVQFLWMVLIGENLFGETTGAGVWLGALVLIGSGLWLVNAQTRAAAPA